MIAPPAPRHVVMLLYPGVQSLDVTGPLEVFAGAQRADRGGGSRERGYEVRMLSRDGAPLRTSSGLTITPHAGLREAPQPIDTLIVAGGPGSRRGGGRSRARRLDRRASTRGQTHGLRLHRRVPARPRRPARRAPREHALGGGGGAAKPASRRARRPRADLRARRNDLDLGRGDRRHGPRAGARRGGSRPRRGPRDRPPPRAVPAPSGQSVPVQRHAGRAAGGARAVARDPAAVVEDVAGEHSIEAMADRAHMSPRHFARAFRAETG